MEVLITEDAIRARIAELGRTIDADFAGRPLTIVAVLTGSLVLLADLMRQVRIPHRVGLLQASSYKGAVTTGSETLKVDPSYLPEVAGRDVLLLDDILDTGRTLGTLVKVLQDRGAASVRVAVLLRKVGRQVVPLEPDYVGFSIPDRFVVGYGLDFDDDFRHLPYVAALPDDTGRA